MSVEYHGETWLHILEAAARMGVSRRTIYNWIEAKKVTTARTAGGQTMILESSLWRARPETTPQRLEES